MKYRFRVALVVFASALAVARAQDQDEERHAPPIEIPDFSNLDEYIYEPRSTVKLGFRHLSGAKTSFFGTGSIFAPENLNVTGPNQDREYHDGYVRPDLRTTPRLDANGNPMIDPQTGAQMADPIAPDGKTNNWSYTDARQVSDAPLGYVAFHSYSADIVDTTVRRQDSRSNNGLDLSVERDMGKLFGGRFSWNLVAGMSINDISAHRTDTVAANLKTITDLYSLYGVTAPAAPYTAPSTTSQTVLDAAGNPVTNADGTTQTISIDNSVLLGNQPAATGDSATAVAADSSPVTDNWKVKGAYYTFRGGPQLWFPVTSRFRAGVSIGAALIYSGTKYTVTQTYAPAVGADITTTDFDSVNKLLPGYYADASLQFDLTDKAGFFAGAVFQSAGSYTQTLDTVTAAGMTHYATKIDLSNQNGLRAGMSIRF